MTKLNRLLLPPAFAAASASEDHSRAAWENDVDVRRSLWLGTLLIPHNEPADGDCQHDLIIAAQQKCL